MGGENKKIRERDKNPKDVKMSATISKRSSRKSASSSSQFSQEKRWGEGRWRWWRWAFWARTWRVCAWVSSSSSCSSSSSSPSSSPASRGVSSAASAPAPSIAPPARSPRPRPRPRPHLSRSVSISFPLRFWHELARGRCPNSECDAAIDDSMSGFSSVFFLFCSIVLFARGIVLRSSLALVARVLGLWFFVSYLAWGELLRLGLCSLLLLCVRRLVLAFWVFKSFGLGGVFELLAKLWWRNVWLFDWSACFRLLRWRILSLCIYCSIWCIAPRAPSILLEWILLLKAPALASLLRSSEVSSCEIA